MEIKGRIVKILPLQSGESRNGVWKRQEFVLEYGEQYPKIVCFSLRGNKIDQYPLAIDDEVIVSFDVESREYNGRYYTDVKAWKIDRAQAGQVPTNEESMPSVNSGFGVPATDFSNKDDKDDLPF